MKLLLSRFINDPTHEYASIINDHNQLRVEHSHDYFELFMVNRGSAVHRTNGVSQLLSKGTMVLMRPDDVHCYKQMSPDFEIINILVPARTMRALFEYLGEDFYPGRFLDSEVPVACRLTPNDFEMIVVQLEQLVLAKHTHHGKSDAIFRFTMLNVIFTCFPATAGRDMPDMPRWLRGLCLEMMKKRNFIEGLPALYRLANKSKEHLSRTFRRHLEKSPTEYINDLRLEYSARTIMSTNAKIVDICGDAGFESVSHYYHLFRKKYGMSPIELRRKAADLELHEFLVDDHVLETGIPTGIPFMKRDRPPGK
ncbi:MAG TPA: AraC family transcriptional regulator [Sedimentisphaerales bacterium]|nr:AraC family transcriptional regulator [Anaerolineales bacterium]HUV66568.1 AraC family transcriptional regulator [Sedimentisphaerales bacterium]